MSAMYDVCFHNILLDSGGSESEDEDAWAVVETSKNKTSKELNVSQPFLNHLMQAELLSSAEKDDITNANTPEKKAKLVIKNLERLDRDGFSGFCRALHATGQVKLLARLKPDWEQSVNYPGKTFDLQRES